MRTLVISLLIALLISSSAMASVAHEPLFDAERDALASDSVTVVVSEPAADPTKRDECKNDGWTWFGFENQGLCIRFINTGKDSR